MARAPNPYYRDPTQAIGQSLATALFGDPGAAAKQADTASQTAQRNAAAEESTAHARYFGSQADGQDTTNTAATALPQFFANMYKPPVVQPTAPTISDMPMWTPGAPSTARSANAPDPADTAPAPVPMWAPGRRATEAAPGRPATEAGAPVVVAPVAPPTDAGPVDPNATFKQGLPALLAALAQSGNGASVDRIVRTFGAFGGGGDAQQRAALIAGGDSPSTTFAGTPQRADQIAATADAADKSKAVAVAMINNRDGIPIANIQAGTGRAVATINHSNDIPVAHIAAPGRVDVAGIKTGDNSLGTMIASMYHGARITSEDRTPAEQQALIASGATSATHSYHVPGNGGVAVDMAPIPGKTLGQVISDLQANGATVLPGTKVEGGGANDGTGLHWHIAVADNGRGKGAPKPKMLNAAGMEMIKKELTARFMGTDGIEHAPVEPVYQAIRSDAVARYQQSGNPVAAVHDAMAARAAMGAKARQQREAGQLKPRRAPDGNWYVQQGQHANGSPAYFQVDGP